MNALTAALLGVVQGLTEFLPVSSSAHLIFARALFGWDSDRLGLAFDVACHVGTLIALVIYFWRDLMDMTRALPRTITARDDPAARQIWLIAIGLIPTVIVGLLFSDIIEERLRTPGIASTMLVLGGLGLIAAERLQRGNRPGAAMDLMDAFWIGAGQAAALVPGVSRSGATLTIALLLGFQRVGAARFVFLLGIPAIVLAAGHESLSFGGESLTAETMILFVIGIVSSAIVGYLTVKYFIRYLGTRSLEVFGWYRVVLGSLVAAFLLTR